MVDYNGLENRRAERHRGFESLSLRNKEASEFSDAFFCCGCEPGSHVLSVASLCESAPSGRARIPLSPPKTLIISNLQEITPKVTPPKKSDFGCFVFLSSWKPIRWNIISPPAFTPKNRIRMSQTCSFPWLFSCL